MTDCIYAFADKNNYNRRQVTMKLITCTINKKMDKHKHSRWRCSFLGWMDVWGWSEHRGTKRRALICTWFPFPTVVTVVHHVNWGLGGVVLTGCTRWGVHGSFVNHNSCWMSKLTIRRSFIVQLGVPTTKLLKPKQLRMHLHYVHG